MKVPKPLAIALIAAIGTWSAAGIIGYSNVVTSDIVDSYQKVAAAGVTVPQLNPADTSGLMCPYRVIIFGGAGSATGFLNNIVASIVSALTDGEVNYKNQMENLYPNATYLPLSAIPNLDPFNPYASINNPANRGKVNDMIEQNTRDGYRTLLVGWSLGTLVADAYQQVYPNAVDVIQIDHGDAGSVVGSLAKYGGNLNISSLVAANALKQQKTWNAQGLYVGTTRNVLIDWTHNTEWPAFPLNYPGIKVHVPWDSTSVADTDTYAIANIRAQFAQLYNVMNGKINSCFNVTVLDSNNQPVPGYTVYAANTTSNNPNQKPPTHGVLSTVTNANGKASFSAMNFSGQPVAHPNDKQPNTKYLIYGKDTDTQLAPDQQIVFSSSGGAILQLRLFNYTVHVSKTDGSPAQNDDVHIKYKSKKTGKLMDVIVPTNNNGDAVFNSLEAVKSTGVYAEQLDDQNQQSDTVTPQLQVGGHLDLKLKGGMTVTLTPTPSTIHEGEAVTLSYTATNKPTVCTLTDDSGGVVNKNIVGQSSMQITIADVGTYNYKLSCSNKTQSGSGTATVTVIPKDSTQANCTTFQLPSLNWTTIASNGYPYPAYPTYLAETSIGAGKIFGAGTYTIKYLGGSYFTPFDYAPTSNYWVSTLGLGSFPNGSVADWLTTDVYTTGSAASQGTTNSVQYGSDYTSLFTDTNFQGQTETQAEAKAGQTGTITLNTDQSLSYGVLAPQTPINGAGNLIHVTNASYNGLPKYEICGPTSPTTKAATKTHKPFQLQPIPTSPTQPVATTTLPISSVAVKLGIFRNSNGSWSLDQNGDKKWDGGDLTLTYGGSGIPSDFPLIGDWTGDGNQKIGVYHVANNQFVLDTNASGAYEGTDAAFSLTIPGTSGNYKPIAGAWSGGKTSVGLYDQNNGTFYLDYNGNSKWDGTSGGDKAITFKFIAGHNFYPLAGDWNHSGTTKIGAYDQNTGVFYLDTNGNGVFDSGDQTVTGTAGMQPVTGDWDGNGTTDVGVYNPAAGQFGLIVNGAQTIVSSWGGLGDQGVVYKNITIKPVSTPITPTLPAIPNPVASTFCNSLGQPTVAFYWDEASRGSQGYSIDISDTGTFDSRGWWYKWQPTGTLTARYTDFSTFAGYSGKTGTPAFTPGLTYVMRVFYPATGDHSNVISFSIPTNCTTTTGGGGNTNTSTGTGNSTDTGTDTGTGSGTGSGTPS